MSQPTMTAASAPAIGRAATLAGIAAVSGRLLVAVPLPWPPTTVAEAEFWWADLGTAGATVALLRCVGIALAAWLLLVAVVGIASTLTRSTLAVAIWRVTTPRSIRRGLLSSVAAISVSLPTVAHAADGPEPPVLHDLGPATDRRSPESGPVLRDLGPHVPAPVAADPPAFSSVATTWTVAAGDHLWRIAEETVAERAAPVTTAAVTRYWQRLIDENRAAIGDDVDLIHPGLVLVLPD